MKFASVCVVLLAIVRSSYQVIQPGGYPNDYDNGWDINFDSNDDDTAGPAYGFNIGDFLPMIKQSVPSFKFGNLVSQYKPGYVDPKSDYEKGDELYGWDFDFDFDEKPSSYGVPNAALPLVPLDYYGFDRSLPVGYNVPMTGNPLPADLPFPGNPLPDDMPTMNGNPLPDDMPWAPAASWGGAAGWGGPAGWGLTNSAVMTGGSASGGKNVLAGGSTSADSGTFTNTKTHSRTRGDSKVGFGMIGGDGGDTANSQSTGISHVGGGIVNFLSKVQGPNNQGVYNGNDLWQQFMGGYKPKDDGSYVPMA